MDNREKENVFLNEILGEYLKRKPTDEDARLCTIKPISGQTYDFYYRKELLGRVGKQFLFGKQNLKFKRKWKKEN